MRDLYVCHLTRTETEAMLEADGTGAVASMTVLFRRSAQPSQGLMPAAKVYMTKDMKFVVHWMDEDLKTNASVDKAIKAAKETLLREETNGPAAKPDWKNVLYQRLTNNADRYVNKDFGRTPERRMEQLLDSIPDESHYCALAAYMSGAWPTARRGKTLANGYDDTVPFQIQVHEALKFLSDPARVAYLARDDNDLRWDLDKAARDFLNANHLVVWKDVMSMKESDLLALPGMTLDIAGQIQRRKAKSGGK